MKRTLNFLSISMIFLITPCISLAEFSTEIPASYTKKAQELFSQIVYVDSITRDCIVNMSDLIPLQQWSEIYKNIRLDLLDSATVLLDADVAHVLAECIEACAFLKEEYKEKYTNVFERYKKLFVEGKAHIKNWQLDAENKLHTRNFDDSRIILQLGVRSLTVEGTEIVNGLLLVNGILNVNGRIILNGVDITNTLSQIVSSTSSGGSGITTINGDTSFVTGSTVAFNGLTSGGSVSFAGNGAQQMILSFVDANQNVLVGTGASSSGASSNVALGVRALASIGGSAADGNVAIGFNTMRALSSGAFNVAMGDQAGNAMNNASQNVIIGGNAGPSIANNNTLIGFEAGLSYNTGSEANNICIGSGVTGTSGEMNTTRIGSGTIQTFIAGIANATISGAMVLTNTATNQLGIATSSKRFKENITAMPEIFSENVLKLQPTLFNYKTDNTKTQIWGLIAEEVQDVLPQLVIADKDGIPYTVKYHELPVLLLNELIKLKKEVEALRQK